MSSEYRCSNSKAIKELIKAFEKNSKFSRKLKSRLFLVILEILKNSSKDIFHDCFSDETIKLMKKHTKLLKRIFFGSRTNKERKQKFLKSKSKFQKAVMHVIKDFLTNCVENCSWLNMSLYAEYIKVPYIVKILDNAELDCD